MSVTTHHAVGCACCGEPPRQEIGRRSFLKMAGSVGLFAAVPLVAIGAESDYEAMVLACIDPRFQEPVRSYLNGRGLTGKYSHFVFAGAAVGVVAPAFKDWHKTFWDNLAASIELHRIRRVIAINHRDCGAARIAYGDAKFADPRAETETHRAALAEFRQQVHQRHPRLAVETGLMVLDGRLEPLG